MNYPLMSEPDISLAKIRRRRLNFSYRFPSVSIFMPFNPKMVAKNKLMFSLGKATDKVINDLRNGYPDEMSLLVVQKLKAILRKLDFNTHKKSLAIFVSPVFEKIYYLDVDVEEKIIVSESLHIRDLLNNKKESQRFHILLLTENKSRIFFSGTNSFINISAEGFILKDAARKEPDVQPAYQSNTPTQQEFVIEKFLAEVDHSLGIVLKHHGLAVVVMGTETLIRQFKKISKNNHAIIEFISGDFDQRSLADLKAILISHPSEWQKIKQKNLLYQLTEAERKNNLSFGLEDVQNDILNHKGKLLIMEKNYLSNSNPLFDTAAWETSRLNDKVDGHFNKFSNIKNPIDEMIEKVLEYGGDVELVNNGVLDQYSRIALIKN